MNVSVPKNLVVIPTARLVDQEMQFDVGRIPPVLIPVNGRPILELILSKYNNLPGVTHFVLAVNEGADRIWEYLKRVGTRSEISVESVGPTSDLAETLEVALREVNIREYENLYINFGDTVVDSPLEHGQDALFYDSLPESFRWATFKVLSDELVIVDKFQTDLENFQSVFTGVFLFKSPERFFDCLVNSREQAQLGRFYVALKSYLVGRSYELIQVKDWLDFGHVDNYFDSKKKFINNRFFNQIKIDPYRAILEKRSEHFSKFHGEIRWYLEIPTALKCYLPQIYEYSLEEGSAFVRLEYYGYPPLSDLYLAGGHSLAIWNHALESIFRCFRDMQHFELPLSKGEIQESLAAMYVDKTFDRLRLVEEDPCLCRYVNSPVTINGTEYVSLSEQLQKLPSLVDEVLVPNLQSFSIIHGDACLSNLLFDTKSRIVKLIDPRGQFGNFSIYGDFRYDLAKLSHSFHGRYELIISDFFEIRDAGCSIDYSLFSSPQQERLAVNFEARLTEYFPDRIQEIRLIEALLFISMIPLHRDHPRRQLMMLAIGIEQYSQVVSSLGER